MRPPNWQSANSLLPVEILQEIFSYLTIQDLGRACQVREGEGEGLEMD